MTQPEEINIGDLLFLPQGLWLRGEKQGTFSLQLGEPRLGVVVEKNISGTKTIKLVTNHYKVCVGDEMYLLDEEDAHKYVRDNGN